ncbi:uroporphyrinogen-III synthase [Tahibacter aquaticus]|uniref:Uroporphyrinogen-III synthase n=1 Tax=Tahibacter aquaticus TaxID=520092 RepID=A0A4R6Z778_9GAMM|nr:uroporphyrinogen-III synthase [Tahibacter aquaticus]TDR47612.1 uroporphyrinogen-III synthase [Tahibacter aquaticus]
MVVRLSLPLSGAGVIVTRPPGTAAALQRLLQRQGAEVVLLPGISLRAIEAADVARRELGVAARADGLIFISPAAVKFAWKLLPSLRLLKRSALCAVGQGTALALARAGRRNDVVVPDSSQDSEGLLAMDALRGVRGQDWCIVGAAGGRDVLAQGLRRRGARVRLIEVYRRAAPRWSRLHFARLETAPKPLILLVSSAQALANLATGLPAGLVLALRAAELVVSSARLAGLAREHGFTRIHVAESALSPALAAAAVQALARHRL